MFARMQEVSFSPRSSGHATHANLCPHTLRSSLLLKHERFGDFNDLSEGTVSKNSVQENHTFHCPLKLSERLDLSTVSSSRSQSLQGGDNHVAMDY